MGFGLRLHELGSVPLRGDEAFSARFWADLPLSTSLAEIAPLDPHPPLAFAIVRFWRHWIGGIDSPTAMRMLGVLANTVGIPAVFALALQLSGRSIVGLSAALIWALHPYEIWHSQDFRNYPIWAGTSVSSLWLGLRLIDLPKPRNWLLYGLAAGVTAFIFYTELFTMLAFAVFTVVCKRTNQAFLRRVIALQAVITASVVFAFLLSAIGAYFLRRISGKCPRIPPTRLSYAPNPYSGRRQHDSCKFIFGMAGHLYRAGWFGGNSWPGIKAATVVCGHGCALAFVLDRASVAAP